MLGHCNKKNSYIIIGALILIPICWLKTFKYIAYVSLIANMTIITSLIVILTYDEKTIKEQPSLHSDLNILTPSNIPFFFGVAVFNFEGNGVVLNIHASMKEPKKFSRVLVVSMSVIIVLVITFASVSYSVSTLIYSSSIYIGIRFKDR
jgi:proton-coupled amino acid transporter